MTFLNTSAIEKALIESAHTLAAAVKSKLLEKIEVYLESGSKVLDAEMLQSSCDVNTFLIHETTIVFSVSNGLQNTLQKKMTGWKK